MIISILYIIVYLYCLNHGRTPTRHCTTPRLKSYPCAAATASDCTASSMILVMHTPDFPMGTLLCVITHHPRVTRRHWGRNHSGDSQCILKLVTQHEQCVIKIVRCGRVRHEANVHRRTYRTGMPRRTSRLPSYIARHHIALRRPPCVTWRTVKRHRIIGNGNCARFTQHVHERGFNGRR